MIADMGFGGVQLLGVAWSPCLCWADVVFCFSDFFFSLFLLMELHVLHLSESF